MTPQQRLKKALADQSLTKTKYEDDEDVTFYEFEGPEEDRPRERRRAVYSFCIYKAGGRFKVQEDRYSKSYRRAQKFLCVNGPKAGEWRLHEEVPNYEQFNRSSGWHRGGGAIRVVLVHGI